MHKIILAIALAFSVVAGTVIVMTEPALAGGCLLTATVVG
jgi:hypothetical protein